MAKQPKGGGITWTNETWNPLRGCSVVSEGCRHCYAMSVAARFNQPGQAYEGLAYRNSSGAHWTGEVRLVEEHLEDPLRWQRPRMIFVNSMSDMFHESLDEEIICRILDVCIQAGTQRGHVFQILTKRAARMRDVVNRYVESRMRKNMVCHRTTTHLPEFMWMGISAEDQKTYDLRFPYLRDTRANTRWLSLEPLLGAINLTGPEHRKDGWNKDDWIHDCDWIVVGGESGNADDVRPMHPQWAVDIRDRCLNRADMGRPWPLPFFFKQWGEYAPCDFAEVTKADVDRGHVILLDLDGSHRAGKSINTATMKRVGKRAAGDLLRGKQWHQFPAMPPKEQPASLNLVEVQ